MGSPGAPDLTLQVAGSEYDLVANRVELTSWTVFSRDDGPALEWTIRGGPLAARPDAFAGKLVSLYADEGSGPVLAFQGRCETGPAYSFDGQLGWVRSYAARGIEHEGNTVPVTHPQDGTDTILWNEDPATNPYCELARTGRNQGQILRDAIEAHAATLQGLGLGGIGTVPTEPAVAHATVAAGAVTVVIDDGGAGYDGDDPPTVLLVGGGGSYTSATPTIAAGAITAVTVSGSSGYTSAPEVWISPLPAALLTDLAALAVVIPHPVTLQGERLYQALAGLVRQIAPNHWLWTAPDGTFRVLDQRDAVPATLTMGTADHVDVANVSFSRTVTECYPRVLVRGGPDTIAVQVGTAPPEGSAAADGGLEEDFEHDGLTTTLAKAAWRLSEFTQPNNPENVAAFTATRSGGAVSALAITRKGYGYTPSTTYTLSLSGGGGTGAAGTFTTDATGQAASTSVTAGGSGYTSAPTVTAPAPPGASYDAGECTCTSTTELTLTPADARRHWPTNHWDQSATGKQGVLWLTYDVGNDIDARFSTRVVSCSALTAGGTCTVTVDPPLPDLAYNYYELIGTAGGGADVWRRYRVTNPVYGGKLLRRFPRPVPYRWAADTAATLTSVPTGSVLHSTSGNPPYQEAPLGFDVNPSAGVIRYHQPTVASFGTRARLEAGGAETDGIPHDVRALLAVNRGNLQAVAPADSGGLPQYAGTSHTVEGLERTLIVTCPTWVQGGNQANMDAYAADLLDSVKDTVIEGTVPLLGWASAWFVPGPAVNLAGSGYDTPWEDAAVPVIECRLTFTRAAGAKYLTTLRCSNKRAAFSAPQYLRPTPEGLILGFAGGSEAFDVRLLDAERRLEDYLRLLDASEASAGRSAQSLRELWGRPS